MRFRTISSVVLVLAVLIIAAYSRAATTVGPYTVTNCASAAACVTGSNANSGPGVSGVSSHGSGVTGATSFKSTSTTAAYGIFGEDSSTSGTNDSGVYGVSMRGVGLSGNSSSNYGVRGTSSQKSGVFGTGVIGVLGQSSGTTGVGVYGVDTNTSGTGLYGQGQTYGVVGNGKNYGVYGAGSSAGVYGVATSGSGGQFIDTSPSSVSSVSTGVQATSTSGFGLYAHSDGSYGALITSAYIGVNSSGSHIGVLALTPSSGFPLAAQNTNGVTVFYVDGQGNVRYRGTFSRFLRTGSGKRITAFATQVTRPSLEDSGTAQLVNGQAVVALDAAFSGTIDMRYSYRVFVTPDGDTRGLYVAVKSKREFVVRELQGGRGTFPFDYRVYGTPLESHGVR